jgi:hypothetical protein
MIHNKTGPTASRPFIFLLALTLIWSLGFAGNAGAQRFQSGSVALVDAGTTITVRTNETIDTGDSDGQVFHGSVASDVVNKSGRIVVPRGSDVEMTVREMDDNQLALDLDSVTIRGERYGVQTESSTVTSDQKAGIGTNKRTGEYVGGGALLGAIIGAITGGGKGAAIGAGVGAAGGAGVQILTRGNHVRVPAESLLTFRLAQPLRAGYGGAQRFRAGNTASTAAYRDGLRDGSSDAESGLSWNLHDERWSSARDRRDYEAGYYAGFQQQDVYGVTREKPSNYYEYEAASVNIGSDRNISWFGPDDSSLYVQVDNSAPQLFASGKSGTQRAPWITRGHRYLFILRDSAGNELARDQKALR